MAVNKRKILETAQKFLQKGALDRALKEYKTLLDLDPRDTSARLKLGDIHLRLGEKADAVAAYSKVAQQFMKDGFDAKAVALFRQITKLAPDQTDIYVPLAELYQRLGLTAEAMSALQTATEVFQKAGRKREALELLRKAASLDPTNTTSRLKIADLLRQQGMTDEALAEYEEVAAEFDRGGEMESLASVYERILEIDPDRLTTLLALARVLVAGADPARACELAERACAARPDLVEAYEIHAEALQALGRDASETEPVYRKLADLHRARGDEERAREILQRFLSGYELTRNGDETLLADVTEQGFLGSSLSEDLPIGVPSASPLADEAVEQRLAEANVYLRFGKRDRAIASLEGVLEAAPDHPGALEMLGRAIEEQGDPERAAQLFERAARAERSRGQETDAARLDARAAGLGAVTHPPVETDSLVADLGQPAMSDVSGSGFSDALGETGSAAPAGRTEPEFEFDIEVDLSGAGASQPIEAAGADPSSALDEEHGLEIELGPDAELGIERDLQPIEERPSGSGASAVFPMRIEIPTEEELAASFGAGALGEDSPMESVTPAGLPEPVPLEPPPPLEPGLGRSTSASASPKQILEDLEEGDFYVQQGLFDEAEAVYRRILEVAPTNPQALLRLGEIAAARGQDPGSSRQMESTGPAATAEPDLPVADPGATALGDDLAEWDSRGPGEDAAVASPSFEIGLEDESAFETEPAGDRDLEADGAEAVQTGDDTAAPGAPQMDPEIGASPADASDTAEAENSVDATREISHFDLAAELTDALALDTPALEAIGSDAEATSPPVGEENLEAIFSEFKRGVSKTLTAADHETHYDLGIAYREMELYDDAMGEFQIALESPARRLDCLHLLGLCAREVKRPHDAVAFFRQALSEPDLPAERRVAIGFDLGIALEESGDAAAALAALEEVAALDPGFPELTDRIEAVRGLLALSAGESAPETTEAPAEVYESFDDLIAQAEAAQVVENGRDEELPTPGSRPEPPAPPARRGGDDPAPPPPPGTPPRRRKVSFG